MELPCRYDRATRLQLRSGRSHDPPCAGFTAGPRGVPDRSPFAPPPLRRRNDAAAEAARMARSAAGRASPHQHRRQRDRRDDQGHAPCRRRLLRFGVVETLQAGCLVLDAERADPKATRAVCALRRSRLPPAHLHEEGREAGETPAPAARPKARTQRSGPWGAITSSPEVPRAAGALASARCLETRLRRTTSVLSLG